MFIPSKLLGRELLTYLKDQMTDTVTRANELRFIWESPLVDQFGRPIWSKMHKVGQTIHVRKPARFTDGKTDD
jgi:hypothetical protein